MIGICMNVNYPDLFSDFSRDVTTAINFMAKFGCMCSSGRVAFENGLEYHHFNSKIFNGNILATFCAIMCKYDENQCSNPRDYEGNNCTFWTRA